MQSALFFLNRKIKGSALILMLIILGIAALVLVGALKSNPQIERDKITADVLVKAKDALIGYAATYRDQNSGQVFGYLPCPDLGRGNEGLEDSSGCIGSGNKDKSVIGRLPWRTLGLPPLRDSNGDCLWYAVSGTFKKNTSTDLLSWDTNGQFELYAPDGASRIAGTSAVNRAVAIIFSPGRPLGSQNRAADAAINAPECGGNMDASNYLDAATVNGTSFSNYLANTVNAAAHVVDAAAYQIKQFITGEVKDAGGNVLVNDRLLFITPADIFANKVEKRSDFQPLLVDTASGMLARTAECLANYGLTIQSATKRLPWAAPLNMDAGSATKYGTNSNYAFSTNTLAGRTPYQADATNTWLNAANVSCPNFDLSTFNWWQNHKDQLFYAVSNAFKPGVGVANCSVASQCLTVDGNGPYAAVVIFSGKKLAGQNRNTSTNYTSADKATLANYLEGNNPTAMGAVGGNGNFTKGTFSSTTNNDVLICLKCDLTLDTTCATTGLSTCACSATTVSWTVGSTNCSAPIGVGSNADTTVLISTVPSTTGSAKAICNVNAWQLSASPAPTCSVSALLPPGSDPTLSNITSFGPAGSGGGAQVKLNADGSATLYITGASNKSGCFWQPAASELYNKTMHAYFKFRFRNVETNTSNSSYGDGLTFTVLPGSANIDYTDGMCGDPSQTGYSGSDGGGHAPLPLPATNLAIEYDVYYNAAYHDPSPANKNHIAVLTGSLDHSGIAFASPCDGTTAGCYPASTPNWLEDNVYHETRIEIASGCDDNTCSNCGASGAYSLVKAWVDCTSCRDLTASFPDTPDIQSCTSTSSWLNSTTKKTVKFGFTSGESAGVRQTIDVSDFGVRFE